jgi:hypothetical protein
MPATPRRREFPGRATYAHQLGAAGEHLGRAALIGGDVRFVMAHDRAVRRAAGGQRQRIGRGAGDDQIRAEVALEHVTQPAHRPCRPLVVAVGHCRAGIGVAQGIEDGVVHARDVVAAEIHGHGWS